MKHDYRKFILRFNNIRLRNKLLICYGVLIIVTVSIIGMFTYFYIQQYVRDQAKESLSQTLDQIITNIEDKINTYDEIASKLIINDQLKFALSREYKSPSEYSYEYLNTIMPAFEFKTKDNNILNITVYKNNNTLPEDGTNLLPMDSIKDLQWFQRYYGNMEGLSASDCIKLSNTRIWFADGGTEKSPGKKVNNTGGNLSVTLVKSMMVNYEKLVGILMVSINYNAVFNEVLSEYTPDKEEIFIVDNDNEIQFSNRSRSLVGTSGTYGDILKNARTGNGYFFTKNRKDDVLLLYNTGKYSGWKYFMGIPMERFLKKTENFRNIIILIALFSILLSFIVGLGIASMISRRISILSDKMSQVENLALDVTVAIEDKDEIGKLARSYNSMIGRLKELVKGQKEDQQRIRETELKALQAQINPHFLYNSLATISWLAMDKDSDSDKIVSMLKNLSMFYRLSLNKGREFLTISDEINQVKAYAYLQKTRMDEKINVLFQVDESILGYYTLKLILQPFVENSILHGVNYKNKLATNIVIRGYEEDGKVLLQVVDDGMGMEMLKIGEYPVSSGYGIRNVHEKVQLQFGCEYGVRIYSKKGFGTVITVEFPATKQNLNLA